MDLTIEFQFKTEKWSNINIKQVVSLVEKYLTRDPAVVPAGSSHVVSIHILDLTRR